MIEGGVQEEALVGEPERLSGFADATLAQGDQLLAFGEGADGDRPFFESNWHRSYESRVNEVLVIPAGPSVPSEATERRARPLKDTKPRRKSQIPCISRGFLGEIADSHRVGAPYNRRPARPSAASMIAA